MKCKLLRSIAFCGLFFGIGLLQAEGFVADTLVSTQLGFVPIQSVVVGDTVKDGDYVIHVVWHEVNHCVKIRVDDCVVCAAPDQRFYVTNVRKWVNASDLIVSDVLLCRDGKTVSIDAIEVVDGSCVVHTLSVEMSHVFYVTPYEIVAHNMDPTGGAAVVFLSVVCPPAGAALAAVEAVALGVVGIGAYCAYKKHKKQKKIAENLEKVSKSTSAGGGGKDPKDEDDKNDLEKYPHGIYEDAAYHHINSKGKKGPCPQDGQTALNNSVPIDNNNSKGRVGISRGEIVVLKETSERLFHGYVTTWKELQDGEAGTQAIRNALRKNGLVSKAGKIIKTIITRRL